MSAKNTSLEESYLSCATRDDRIQFLKKCLQSGEYLDLHFVKDMMLLPLSHDEKSLLIRTCYASDTLALEEFFWQVFQNETQDLAVPAIIEAAARTPGFLAHRYLVGLLQNSKPQRVLFTLLNEAKRFNGSPLIKTLIHAPAIEELSPAFHALLFQQAVLLNVHSPRFDAIADTYIANSRPYAPIEDRVLINMIPYLIRYKRDSLQDLLKNKELNSYWQSFIFASGEGVRKCDKTSLQQSLQKASSDADLTKIFTLWPYPWERHAVNQDLVRVILDQVDVNFTWQPQHISGFMLGVDAQHIEDYLIKIDDGIRLCHLTSRLYNILPKPTHIKLAEAIRNQVTAAQNPAPLLALLPHTLKEHIKIVSGSPHAAALLKEREQACKKLIMGTVTHENEHIEKYSQDRQPQNDREVFFSVAYRKQVGLKPQTKDFWSQLTSSWLTPDINNLKNLSENARQQTSIAQLAYLVTLSRYQDRDEAALKTLDFIHSENEDELRAVIQTLASIASERALQELILMITKPNITAGLQLEICEQLKDKNLVGVQMEIRRTISDLTINIDEDDIRNEVRDNLKLLLQTDENEGQNLISSSIHQEPTGTKSLDQNLAKILPHYDRISSEVKSALRTSAFFHESLLAAKDVETIDFSPLIDMQYKALELIFREMFETPTHRLISQGILQRKLDLIGYARPIPQKMDEFEDYISNLDIIQSVPFFSKFKLRKMLRALCQFRPGRRFTLDGLKAFALFFLCFSRRECKYGLGGLFSLPYQNDAELFEFVKSLHIYQDFRNRAAHEGFPPAARNNIDGIWRSTADILHHVYLIRDHIEGGDKKVSEKSKVA